jgi:hypothetical protein
VDEPEYEVTDLRSHSLPPAFPERTQPAPPGTLLSRSFRLALAAGSILLALIVIVSVWLPLHPQPHLSTTLVPFPTFPGTATPVLTPTPLPITSTLASPPTHCPAAPPLTTVTVPAFDGFYGGPVQLTGRAPVWIVENLYPLPSVVDLSEPTPPSSANPEWPAIPIIWAIGPNAHPTVTVQVRDLQSHTLAWWGAGGESGPQWPILTLNAPADIPAHSYVAGAPWLLFITRSGCFKMDVTWPGGSWSLIFAAGAGSSK